MDPGPASAGPASHMATTSGLSTAACFQPNLLVRKTPAMPCSSLALESMSDAVFPHPWAVVYLTDKRERNMPLTHVSIKGG